VGQFELFVKPEAPKNVRRQLIPLVITEMSNLLEEIGFSHRLNMT